jgi:GNAT superfamily N-acetyltransferase
MLASAFDDDPMMIWLFGDDGRGRPRRIERFFRIELRRHLAHDGFLISDDHAAAALFAPPGHCRMPWLERMRIAPAMLRILGRRAPRARRLEKTLERLHPAEPHIYLHIVGTHPRIQRRGLAAAMIEPIVERADREGVGMYGEVTRKENVSYYERFGARLVDEIPIPGGLTLWRVWRNPVGP